MRTLFDAVTTEAARLSGLSLAEVRGDDRKRMFSQPRQRAMWAIRTLRPDISRPRIGHYFGRDHTTVLHACRVIDAKRSEDEFERALTNALVDAVRPRSLDGPVGQLDAVDARLAIAAMAGRSVAEAAAHAQVSYELAESRLTSMAEALARAVGRGLVERVAYSHRPPALVLRPPAEKLKAYEIEPGRRVRDDWDKALFEPYAVRKVRLADQRGRTAP